MNKALKLFAEKHFGRRREQKKKEEKETIFLDLREPYSYKEESDMNFESLQRILRLNSAQNKQYVFCSWEKNSR